MSAEDWSSVRVTAAILAIATLVVGIGALLVMLGRQLMHGSNPSLGDVTMPAQYSALEIGADYVPGIRRDEFDVESIHQFKLIKPSPSE